MHSKKSVCLTSMQANDIPVEVTKDNSNFFTEQICACFNESISKGKFPKYFKLAIITPCLKKGAHTPKTHQRLVSMLLVFSKIFDKLLQKQLLVFFNNILPKFQCGFRKG